MSHSDRLEDLNKRFIEIYEAARGVLIETQMNKALIVVHGERMLFFHGSREPQTITGIRPPLYTKLKTLGHVPLAIYSLLTLEAGAPVLSDETLTQLSEYRNRLVDCAATLDAREHVEGGELPRPVTVYERSLAFLDTVIERLRVSETALDAFTAGMTDDLHCLFAAAARAQLDAVHERIRALRETVLTPREWKDLRVVVMGPHMAHKDDLFLQYFAHVLHTPLYTDKRLVYFEGDDEDGALALLGTTLIDGRLSRAFFGEENRMHRDILSNAAKRYLSELLGTGRR